MKKVKKIKNIFLTFSKINRKDITKQSLHGISKRKIKKVKKIKKKKIPWASCPRYKASTI